LFAPAGWCCVATDLCGFVLGLWRALFSNCLVACGCSLQCFCFGCFCCFVSVLWGFFALFCSPVVVAGGFVSCVLVALYASVSESDSKSA